MVNAPPGETLRNLAAPLCRLAGRAGRLILEVYGSDFTVAHKEDKTPITEADRRSHVLITGGLARLTCPPLLTEPLPVLSEEGRDIPYDERRGWKTFWMVDPLDGTKEFVSRNGEFTVNIALIRNGRPVCGVVYAPVPDVLYFGAEGEGAFRLDHVQTLEIGRGNLWAGSRKIPGGAGRTPDGSGRMRDGSGRTPDGSGRPPDGAGSTAGGAETPSGSPVLRVAGSRSHRSPDFQAFLESLREKHGEVELTTAGSSLKFCLVAEGRADVYPRLGPTMEWDTAAGHAVVLAAGGSVKVVDRSRMPTDRELTYNKRELINEWFICR